MKWKVEFWAKNLFPLSTRYFHKCNVRRVDARWCWTSLYHEQWRAWHWQQRVLRTQCQMTILLDDEETSHYVIIVTSEAIPETPIGRFMESPKIGRTRGLTGTLVHSILLPRYWIANRAPHLSVRNNLNTCRSLSIHQPHLCPLLHLFRPILILFLPLP